MTDRTHDGRSFRILNILNEYTRECLASVVARRIRSQDVLLILADLFLSRGIPMHIRSDNGPEFIAIKLRHWLKVLQVAPLSLEPGVSLGKWLYRIVQWENVGTVSKRRAVLYAPRNADPDGTLAEALQHGPPAQQSWCQPPAPETISF